MPTKPAFSARSLLTKSRQFERPSWRIAASQLATSLCGLAAMWALMLHFHERSAALAFAVSPLAAGFLLRLFMIQHDCGHHSFVPHARTNDLLGRFLGIITLTPYDYWRATHARHHAAPGKLGGRGEGDILMLTVTEYCALPKWKQYLYRAYRSPFLMFGVGAPLLFLLYYRAPRSRCLSKRRLLANVAFTNLGLALGCFLLGTLIGPKSLAAIYLPTVFLASAFGAWLFFVQHQFEGTYWADGEDWDFFKGAIEGSSYIVLPRVFNWFTGDIAIHHVHHLNSRIPNYRLRSFLTAYPEFSQINRLNWRDGIRATNLVLWDEANRRLIPFGGA